jgi:SAM-dependent methyltransferase
LDAAVNSPATGDGVAERYPIAYEDELVPPLALMRTEGIDVLEDWFRWAEEWSVLLRVHGQLQARSSVLEIGCGLGRVAFPLRYVLLQGTYDGFDIVREKIEWLTSVFNRAHPNFRFEHADVRNSYYNPKGVHEASEFRFPYGDAAFDVVFAASVFTHMVPYNTANYFCEAARVLRADGRCMFSFFVLDNYRPGRRRPLGFARPDFDFDHPYDDFGDDFRTVVPSNPEQMTAYRLCLVERLATAAGLEVEAAVPGLWSGTHAVWHGSQDLVVLRRHAPSEPDAGDNERSQEGEKRRSRRLAPSASAQPDARPG